MDEKKNWQEVPVASAWAALAWVSSVLLAGSLAGCVKAPPPPATLACSTAPAAIYPGNPVTITGSASGLNPKKPEHWEWKSTGGTVASNENSASVGTAGLSPGNYTLTGRVSVGPKPGEFATCEAAFTVKGFEPPTIGCSVSPSTISPGASATIAAVGVSPQNLPLTYSYSSTEGAVSGGGKTAEYSSAGAQPGAVGIVCKVSDDKGNSVSASTTLNILLPPPPPPSLQEHYSCIATPSQVRAGDPVVLSVKPKVEGNSVEWRGGPGILDAGVQSAVLDTKGVAAGQFESLATVMRAGKEVGGCTASFTVDPNAPVTPWPTLNIVRIPLVRGQQESAGFAVYTYVLYRRRPVSDEEQQRFKNILEAVAAHVSPEDFGQAALAPEPQHGAPPRIAGTQATSRRELAPIVVPVDSDGPTFTGQWLYDHYDPAFAGTLLSNLECQRTTNRGNCAGKLSGDGPYLVSTVIRLTGRPNSFLVQDLSGTSPEVGGEWVSAYMSMVAQKKNWTSGYTLQRAELDFAKQLDTFGGDLGSAKQAVEAATALFHY